MKNLKHLKLVLDYILSHERQDFYENPSTNHIFYHATCAAHGEIEAQNEYQMALEECYKGTN